MYPSVNFHLTKACNMRCKFCFATFNDLHNVHHDLPRSEKVIRELASAGFRKITFAGGEPTLVKELPYLARLAKSLGMTTTIVTNGTKLAEQTVYDELIPHLDWVAISIDSVDDFTNLASGRALRGITVLSEEYYLGLIQRLQSDGVRIKINTVVSRFNHLENFNRFIDHAKPERWKVLQAMPVEGQNSAHTGTFEISNEQFETFLERNSSHSVAVTTVPESIELIRGSYIMVSPEGCFFDSTKGHHTYSEPIYEVGAFTALSQINYDHDLFLKRGGEYNWENSKSVIPERITISGEVASGKSSVGKLLALMLDYKFVSLGNEVRLLAALNGMSIVEFQRECEKDKTRDLEIDHSFSTKCNAEEHLVIDYRLGYHFISNAYHVFLGVSEDVAVHRMRRAGRANETFVTVQERNRITRQQFINAYNVDYTDVSNYDLVVNTESFGTQEEIAQYIFETFTKTKTDAG